MAYTRDERYYLDGFIIAFNAKHPDNQFLESPPGFVWRDEQKFGAVVRIVKESNNFDSIREEILEIDRDFSSSSKGLVLLVCCESNLFNLDMVRNHFSDRPLEAIKKISEIYFTMGYPGQPNNAHPEASDAKIDASPFPYIQLFPN